VDKTSKAVPIVVAILLVLCACVIVLLAGAYYLVKEYGQSLVQTVVPNAPDLPFSPTPTNFQLTRLPPGSVPDDTLTALDQAQVPVNDYAELACRLEDKCGLPATLTPPAAPLTAGTQGPFWVFNEDTMQTLQVTATLRYVTSHVYFWVDDTAQYNQADLQKLADTFENKIYPTDRAFFGSEWSPGIDGDVHIYILYTHGMGSSVAGYFSSDDEYNPAIRKYSNGHEMFVLSSSQNLADEYTYGTLAHEFQHMIEWHQHRNQSTWMSEGSAELASFLNGYYTSGFDMLFALNPDLQLNTWSDPQTDPNSDTVHYGASFLFLDYFLNRFGKQATQTLVSEPANGLQDVDQTLKALNVVDPSTGQPVTADDVFLDWAVTNFVHDASVGDGRYTYANYPAAPTVHATQTLSSCPLDPLSRTVHQYAADYLAIDCRGSFTLDFTGASSVNLLPVDPHSGKYAFWSNLGDSSDMTLTHSFDFTRLSGPISLSYWTWYDLENTFDYVYLEASTDGQHWQILQTPSGTNDNTTGSSFGWGYTGSSDGWKQETVDLSAFAGQTVSLRFEYVTDLAVNGKGFLLDDVSIPAAGYASDFERDDGGWQAQGFARIENLLPQTFKLALVERTATGTTVQDIPVADDGTAAIPLTIGSNGVNQAVLVVAATTPFTLTEAGYQIAIK